MERRTILRQTAWGAAILSRIDDTYIPPDLTRFAAAFRVAQAALARTTRKAKTARERRDAALSKLARADAALERALLSLGKRLVSAGLTARKRRSAFSAVHITTLDPARQAQAVRRLVGPVTSGRTTPPLVRKAATASMAAASKVETVRAQLQTAQRHYVCALEARDLLLDRWTVALARLQRRAEETFAGNVELYAHIFAPLGEGTDDEPRTVADLAPVLPGVMNGVHHRT
jgi:hypothetical protein